MAKQSDAHARRGFLDLQNKLFDPLMWVGLAMVLGTACGDDSGGAGETTDATNSSTLSGVSSGTSDASDADTGPGATDEGSATGGSSTGGSTSGGGGSPGCGLTPPAPGTIEGITVDVDGTTRELNLFVPTTYAADVPAALVLNFHGLTDSPTAQANRSDFNDTAEARGMLVAYPVGIGASFNAGACCGTAQSDGVDDVGFSRALVQKVSEEFCVDPKRVYATGMSNGGHMAHTLGCQAADVFAAVASVTGVMGLNPAECTPARPIPVMDFHGTGDFIVPYGGAGPGFPPVGAMMADWAARNGCAADSDVILTEGDVTCESWPDCTAGVEVTLCTVDGGGHCWPGDGGCIIGSGTTDVNASEMIADLFERQTLP